MKKKIIIGLAVLILVGGGGGAYYFLVMAGSSPEEEVAADAAAQETIEEEKEALFHTLPPLVVSSNYNGSLRYLQVKLSILTRSEKTLEKLKNNTPLIQNALIMLLDTFKFRELDNAEGKEILRAQAEEKVRELTSDDGVESVLFTGFVIQ